MRKWCKHCGEIRPDLGDVPWRNRDGVWGDNGSGQQLEIADSRGRGGKLRGGRHWVGEIEERSIKFGSQVFSSPSRAGSKEVIGDQHKSGLFGGLSYKSTNVLKLQQVVETLRGLNYLAWANAYEEQINNIEVASRPPPAPTVGAA